MLIAGNKGWRVWGPSVGFHSCSTCISPNISNLAICNVGSADQMQTFLNVPAFSCTILFGVAGGFFRVHTLHHLAVEIG